MSEQRARYKVTNWGSYNKSLVARGSVTLWWEEGVEETWYAEEAMHRRGRPCTYSDRTMELCMTLKALFHLPYRATEGFVQSLLALMHLTLRVPCYTQIHRRAKTLTGVLKRYAKHQGSVDMVVDSTGLKIYGEGEWKVRTHGASKRRTWRKLHIGIDPLNHEVLCMVLTGAELSDDHALPQLLAQVPDPIERCIGDGAFDTSACYEACHARGIRLLTPPCRNAVAEPPGQERDAMAPRNRAIERIQTLMQEGKTLDEARKEWKNEAHYHERSLVETTMFRFKTIHGNRLFSRLLSTQQQEVTIKINILNKFTNLGMPNSIPVYP